MPGKKRKANTEEKSNQPPNKKSRFDTRKKVIRDGRVWYRNKKIIGENDEIVQ